MSKKKYLRTLELYDKHFGNSNAVTKENKKAVKKYCMYKRSDKTGVSKLRIKKLISNLKTILIHFAPKDFFLEDSEESEIREICTNIKDSDYSESSKSDYRGVLKNYYKVMEGKHGNAPEKAQFISTARKGSRDIDPLTKSEMEAIFDQLKNDRDIALFNMLYEGGFRPHELINIKLKDLDFEKQGVKVTVDGKTGKRTVMLKESERPLINWLQKHPFSDNREAPLWVKINKKNPEEYEPEEIKFTYSALYRKFKRKCTSANVRTTKRKSGSLKTKAYPYLFRHTRATELALKLPTQVLKKYFGWTQSSDMADVYVHMEDSDVHNITMKKLYGIELPDQEEEVEICTRCNNQIKKDKQFCPRCGKPLKTREGSKNSDELLDKFKELLSEGKLDNETLSKVGG